MCIENCRRSKQQKRPKMNLQNLLSMRNEQHLSNFWHTSKYQIFKCIPFVLSFCFYFSSYKRNVAHIDVYLEIESRINTPGMYNAFEKFFYILFSVFSFILFFLNHRFVFRTIKKINVFLLFLLVFSFKSVIPKS